MSIQQTINCNELSQKLWSGTLTNLKHDVLKHSVELSISVTDSGFDYSYLLICIEVEEFKIAIDHPEEDWDYVELTEVEIEHKNEIFFIKFDLWSLGKMLIKCKNLKFIKV